MVLQQLVFRAGFLMLDSSDVFQNRHLLCLVNRAHRVEKPTGRKGVEYVTTSDNTVV